MARSGVVSPAVRGRASSSPTASIKLGLLAALALRLLVGPAGLHADDTWCSKSRQPYLASGS
jgi:hypothetical protein